MSTLELRLSDSPVLLFGGPYGNLQATEALKQQAQALGITSGNTICTGDVAAYCAQPNETIELLQEWGVHVLMGNCEESLAANAEDCGCGFEDGTQCSVLSNSWYAFNRDTIKPHNKIWMAGLPRRLEIAWANKRFTVVHGSLNEINKFVFASSAASVKAGQISAASVDGIIAGHCGLPFSEIINGKLWHNPGAIGMPANDGTARVWYSLLRPEENAIQVEHHSLSYDAQRAANAMHRAGLSNGYADALITGLWPSMDVLPAAERAVCGQAIAESHLLYAV